MHTVMRRRNTWAVWFRNDGLAEHIITFDSGQDAFAFCNYMNGGKGGRSPNLTEDGWAKFLSECSHYSKEEMEAND